MAQSPKEISILGKFKDEISKGMDAALGKVKEFDQEIRDHNKKYAPLQKSVKDLETAFTTIAAPIAAAGAALAAVGYAAFEISKKFADTGQHLQNMSMEFGTSTDDLVGLGGAMSAVGMTMDDAGPLMKKLGKSMEDAVRDPASKSAQAFKDLGIKVTDAQGKIRPINDVLMDVADRFHDTADGAGKVAVATELMGRNGAALIPVLDGGSKSMKDWKEYAEKVGATWSPQELARASQFKEEMAKLGLGFQGIGKDLANEVIPYVIDFIKELEKAISWVHDNDIIMSIRDITKLLENIWDTIPLVNYYHKLQDSIGLIQKAYEYIQSIRGGYEYIAQTPGGATPPPGGGTAKPEITLTPKEPKAPKGPDPAKEREREAQELKRINNEILKNQMQFDIESKKYLAAEADADKLYAAQVIDINSKKLSNQKLKDAELVKAGQDYQKNKNTIEKAIESDQKKDNADMAKLITDGGNAIVKSNEKNLAVVDKFHTTYQKHFTTHKQRMKALEAGLNADYDAAIRAARNLQVTEYYTQQQHDAQIEQLEKDHQDALKNIRKISMDDKLQAFDQELGATEGFADSIGSIMGLSQKNMAKVKIPLEYALSAVEVALAVSSFAADDAGHGIAFLAAAASHVAAAVELGKAAGSSGGNAGGGGGSGLAPGEIMGGTGPEVAPIPGLNGVPYATEPVQAAPQSNEPWVIDPHKLDGLVVMDAGKLIRHITDKMTRARKRGLRPRDIGHTI